MEKTDTNGTQQSDKVSVYVSGLCSPHSARFLVYLTDEKAGRIKGVISCEATLKCVSGLFPPNGHVECMFIPSTSEQQLMNEECVY